MTFFLLAGGLGERAKPLSLEKPKPLFPLDGIPLIKWMLTQLKERGCRQGFINLHHLPEQIPPETKGILPITFLHEEMLSGSRILSQTAPAAGEGLLVLNGDIFLEIPLADLQRELTEYHCDAVLLVRPAEPGYAVLRCANGWFSAVDRAPTPSITPDWMYTGVGLFTQSVLHRIGEPNFFTTLERYRFRVRCLPYRGIWLEIGTPRKYFDTCWTFSRYRGGNQDNILSDRVRIDPDVSISGSVVWENTHIGSGCRLDRCIVTATMDLRGVQASDRILSHQGDSPIG